MKYKKNKKLVVIAATGISIALLMSMEKGSKRTHVNSWYSNIKQKIKSALNMSTKPEYKGKVSGYAPKQIHYR